MPPTRPIEVKTTDDLICGHCVYYQDQFDPERETCHLSQIPFSTRPDNFCADGHFLFEYADQLYLFVHRDAYSAIVNPESVFEREEEEDV